MLLSNFFISRGNKPSSDSQLFLFFWLKIVIGEKIDKTWQKKTFFKKALKPMLSLNSVQFLSCNLQSDKFEQKFRLVSAATRSFCSENFKGGLSKRDLNRDPWAAKHLGNQAANAE